MRSTLVSASISAVILALPLPGCEHVGNIPCIEAAELRKQLPDCPPDERPVLEAKILAADERCRRKDTTAQVETMRDRTGEP